MPDSQPDPKMQEAGKKAERRGTGGEKRVREWLEERGFKIIEAWDVPHAGHYDIKAQKGRDKWIIDVKAGERPSISIGNFVKMVDEKGFNKIGLALVSKEEVFLLELRKETVAALRAWRTRRLGTSET